MLPPNLDALRKRLKAKTASQRTTGDSALILELNWLDELEGMEQKVRFALSQRTISAGITMVGPGRCPCCGQ